MGYPSASRRYLMLAETGLDSETLGYASIFAARCRFADAFEGIRVEGIRKDTVRGYEILMRLLLIQTTLEALKKVTGRKIRLESEPLTARLRADSELVEVLLDPEHRHIEYGRKKKQDAAIADLAGGGHCDLSVILQRVRNMFAHGDSTSNRFALDRRKSRREFFAHLGDLGLAYADNEFTAWVDSQLKTDAN